MKKVIKTLIFLAVLVAIVCTGWLFFRNSMSIHPLVRDCYAALVRLDPGSEEYLMKIACFAIDDKDGARLLLICETPGKGSPQKPEAAKRIEAVFPLTQDPAEPQPKADGNPFENPGLIISSFTVKEDGQSKTFTVDPPLRGVPTPKGMHRPVGTITGFRGGHPVGPRSLTSYNRAYHFFRYEDAVGEQN